MYDSPMDYYKNAEPRLRAYVIFPGDMFKGKEIEIYAGVYTGSTPIKPLLSDYSYGSATTKYNHLSAYKEKPKTLYLSPKSEDQQEIVTLPDGSTMKAAGQNGPFYEDGGSAMTGLLARKWLNPDPAFVPREGNSAQPFILMRYAAVLLNAPEAAVELSLAGVSSPDDTDMLSVATKAINDIRERAGARLLTSSLAGTIDSRDIVRKERRKELAFEHKTKWDLRRWRVTHYEGRDGFWGDVTRTVSATRPVIVSVVSIRSIRRRQASGSSTFVSTIRLPVTKTLATLLWTITSRFRVVRFLRVL